MPKKIRHFDAPSRQSSMVRPLIKDMHHRIRMTQTIQPIIELLTANRIIDAGAERQIKADPGGVREASQQGEGTR